MTPYQQQRFSRHLCLDKVGEEGQEKIFSTKVLVIGAGGLGVPVIQYLAAAGVGTLCIVDDDTIDISNLQRQVLYSENEIGGLKAEVAADQARRLNNQAKVLPLCSRLTFEMALDLFPKFDIIVDGTDNYDSRYAINDAAVITGKPVVSGSVFQLEGQLTVYNYQNGPTYRCLFPDEEKLGFGCTETGVLGPLVGIIGSHMALEVLKIATGAGDVLTGILKLIDGMSNETFQIAYNRNKEMIEIALQRAEKQEITVS